MKRIQQLNEHLNLSVYLANFIITGLLLTCMMCPHMSFAQQQRTYYSFSYFKLSPGKEHEVRKMIETVCQGSTESCARRSNIQLVPLYNT